MIKQYDIVRVKEGSHKNYKINKIDKDLKKTYNDLIKNIKSIEGKKFIVSDIIKDSKLKRNLYNLQSNEDIEFGGYNITLQGNDLEVLYTNYFNNCCVINTPLSKIKCDICGLDVENLLSN